MRSLLLLFLLSSTALANETGRAPQLPVKPETGPRELLKTYATPAQTFAITLGKAKRTRRVVEREVSFPSPVTARWGMIHGTYYRSARLRPDQKVPAAVVVHHLGGSFEAEAMLARHYAVNGVSAFFISLPNYGKRQEKGTKQGFMRLKPTVAFKAFHQAARDVIRAADFLRSRPEVDPERVGVVGVSLGAFVSALAKGVDPRLRQTVLILGGGDLVGLFDNVPEAKELFERSGLERAVVVEALRVVDPITFAQRVPGRDVLMLNALNDEIVPRTSTDQLWKAFGKPEIRWFRCGHYGIVLHVPTVMNLSLDHLRR